MNTLYLAIAFFSGIFTSMGLGGGTILISFLYLIDFGDQSLLQGINLIFFLAVALISLIFHIKNRLVIFDKTLHLIIFGIIGAVLGSLLSGFLPQDILRRLFGCFILYSGFMQLKQPVDHSNNNREGKNK